MSGAIERQSDSLAWACATQTFALLPKLRRFVTTRVRGVGAEHELSLRQFAALRGIHDGAGSPGELARLWQVTPAVITGIVDRLEGRGLVRREADLDDRRRLRLVLTEAGRRVSDEVELALTGELAARLAVASEAELAELNGALDLLRRTFDGLDAAAAGDAPCSLEDDMPVWDDEARSAGAEHRDARRPGPERTPGGRTGGRR